MKENLQAIKNELSALRIKLEQLAKKADKEVTADTKKSAPKKKRAVKKKTQIEPSEMQIPQIPENGQE